ncbi:hypothetical protein ILUMI_23220 [Ignelater luminosus]|uniref:Peptidase M12B propeptide domain-containing protein n=1 Tax=Ignelater luminosus TaxID=2038154 RepID=A0A8K0CBB2_IGNLU|nr:hypothetical protein ILUMI_23220 [Ignelater luminosus]
MWGAKRWSFITTYLICGGVVACLQITEENLKHLLSKAEWLSLVENSNSDIDYSISYPSYQTVRTKRSSGTEENSGKSPTHHLVLEAPALGRTFDLQLLPSPDLLAPGFTVLETFANGSQVIPHHAEDLTCYYRSERAALSLCGSVVRKLII